MKPEERVLVTGGAGFIGSHLVRRLAVGEGLAVTNLDLLTYAGNPDNLKDVEGSAGYRFVCGDVAEPAAVREAIEGASVVFHLAAESHVDRSIEDAEAFMRTNILGTRVVLEEALAASARVVLVSTDEVYGSLTADDEPGFTESSPLLPNSPYAASKAAADLLARAWCRTYDADVVVTRCSNNYGPNQFPEKFLPLMTLKALGGEALPIYGDGQHRRDWLHVTDHCDGLVKAWRGGRAGEIYNLGTGEDRANVDMAHVIQIMVGEECGSGGSTLENVPDRPGHDRRYSVDASKAREELGWEPRIDLQQGVRETIRWYRDNEDWWQRIVSGAYLVERRRVRHEA